MVSPVPQKGIKAKNSMRGPGAQPPPMYSPLQHHNPKNKLSARKLSNQQRSLLPLDQSLNADLMPPMGGPNQNLAIMPPPGIGGSQYSG